MGALAVGEAVGGILGGIAVVVVCTVWVWRWREQTRAEIATLKTQVAGLERAVVEAQQLLTKHVDVFNRMVSMIEDTVTATGTAVDKLADESTAQAHDITELRQHVKDLSNGIMPRVGGTHPAE